MTSTSKCGNRVSASGVGSCANQNRGPKCSLFIYHYSSRPGWAHFREDDYVYPNQGWNCRYPNPLPCFSPEFIGFMDVFASAAFVLGTALYNRYLAGWSYRNILRAVQLVLCAVNMLDLIWVSRWNLLLGVPDNLFAMGCEALAPTQTPLLTHRTPVPSRS